MATLLPQRCPVAFLYLNWVLYLGLAAVFVVRRDFLFLVVWLVVAPPLLYAYVRLFPRLSRMMGYGDVTDDPVSNARPAAKHVTMYSGLGCPFCPILESRLRALQPAMGLEIEIIDVTLRPDIARKARVGSVPLIEVEGRRRAGCMTSHELVELIVGDTALVPKTIP